MSQPLSNASPAQSFAWLPEDQRNSLLAQLAADAGCTIDEIKVELAWRWDGWLARPSQLEPPGDWLYWVIKAGRGFGKTRIGAEWVRKQIQRFPRVGLIGKDAADMRSVMIEGESGIMAVCPPHERPVYLPSIRTLRWPNGAISECRTGEDPEGVRGVQFHRLWCDEIAAWQYPQETWDMALLATRLGEDPRVCVTSTPKPIRLVRELLGDVDAIVSGGSTYENLANLGPTYRTIIGRYEGTRLGRQELHAEMLDTEGLAYPFSERIHTMPRFDIPDAWERFESMDYGPSQSSATAWYAYAVDYDGNVIVFDELYEPGMLPSDLAPLVLERRKEWHPDGTGRVMAYGDPAIFNAGQTTNKWGKPAVVNDEFQDLGIQLTKANNDRRAGFVRIGEMVRLDQHAPPVWATHLPAGIGAPRLFIFDHCKHLIEQMQDAPLEDSERGPNQGRFPGEAVAEKWESSHGHAHASLRYGLMSRPSPSKEPDEQYDDPRAEMLRKHRRERETSSASRFQNV